MSVAFKQKISLLLL